MMILLEILTAVLMAVVVFGACIFVRDVGEITDAETISVLAASLLAIILLFTFFINIPR